MKFRISPFEFLYVAIAIATFEHTMWSAAFMFDGPLVDNATLTQTALWYLRGALIAIAIDVGMFMTSRHLPTAHTFGSRFTLVVAFFVAAISSFYTQIAYIVYHTPQFTLSEGVTSYWTGVLQPFIDARVILLPFILPGLALIYTLARLAHEHQIEQEAASIAEAEKASRITVNDIPTLAHKHLPSGETHELAQITEGRVEIQEGVIDWDEKMFQDAETGKWHGPYKTDKTLLAAIKARKTRRQRRQTEK